MSGQSNRVARFVINIEIIGRVRQSREGVKSAGLFFDSRSVEPHRGETYGKEHPNLSSLQRLAFTPLNSKN